MSNWLRKKIISWELTKLTRKAAIQGEMEKKEWERMEWLAKKEKEHDQT